MLTVLLPGLRKTNLPWTIALQSTKSYSALMSLSFYFKLTETYNYRFISGSENFSHTAMLVKNAAKINRFKGKYS